MGRKLKVVIMINMEPTERPNSRILQNYLVF